MKIRIADGEYRNSYAVEVKLSEFAYSPKDNCLVFTMGIYDGFYPSQYKPDVVINLIQFFDSYVKVIVNTKAEVELLANDLVSKNKYFAETRANVRM